jgi:hypothetical protein
MPQDHSVDHIKFISAAGYACRTSSDASTSSGDVQTSREFSGNMNMWRYRGRFASAGALRHYGDGNYLIVLYSTIGPEEKAFVLNEPCYLLFSYGPPLEAPPAATAEEFLEKTRQYGLQWVKTMSITPICQGAMIRAALVLERHRPIFL